MFDDSIDLIADAEMEEEDGEGDGDACCCCLFNRLIGRLVRCNAINENTSLFGRRMEKKSVVELDNNMLVEVRYSVPGIVPTRQAQ